MKRSATTQPLESQTTVTTTKKLRPVRVPRSMTFAKPAWAGKSKTGFPKELKCRHRYVSYVTITSSAGALGSYSYRCNGMFDPDATSTGHQPLYFDQLAAIYNHFVVTNSKIDVKIVAGSANSAIPLQVNMFVNDDTTVTATPLYAQSEQNSAKFGFVPILGNGVLHLRDKWSAAQAFGPNPVSNNDLEGTGAADPTEQQVWSIQYQTADLAATSVAYMQVVIEYDAVWKELKDILPSS